jgi:hypothetical protein
MVADIKPNINRSINMGESVGYDGVAAIDVDFL